MTERRALRAEMDDALLDRYSRHLLMPEIDVSGQERLRNSRVLIVGAGGLGCPVALYLGAAGIGALTIADGDQVEVSNLQRQIGHTHAELGENKAISLRETLSALNVDCQVAAEARYLDEVSLAGLIATHDVVVDCSDNFMTRDLVNRFCVQHKTPLVSGAAIRAEGQLAVFDLRLPDAPCYRCVYPDLSEDALGCNEAGVLGPLVGVIGSMQALETVNVLLGKIKMPRPLLTFSAFDGQFQSFRLRKRSDCVVCR